ncbi:MAG: hypothetical protein JOZ73_00235, partial [Solirubrobacterales bacterium]|nr:hypothetical protein [Solirubrobacterales bacterium]
MSRASEIDQLETDVRYYHDRIALLRAKLYRWGLGRTARLQTLERQLASAERRLREVRLR